MNKGELKILEDEKEISDKLRLKYLNYIDIEVCEYVISQLQGINVGNINYGENISFNEMVEGTLKEIEILGTDMFYKIKRLIRLTPVNIETFGDSSCFGTSVCYKLDQNDNVLQNSCRISEYNIPADLRELHTFFFVHEQMHAVKDTNYSEYVYNLILGETIPIFYEFMIYNPNEVLKKELIKFRLKYLLINRLEYEKYVDKFDNSYGRDTFILGLTEPSDMTKLYEYICSKIGRYLNSFYYALILYNMYKENADKILRLVSKVLNQEMTTYELLCQLNIYGDIKGEVFEKEVGLIRKLVK